VLLFGICAVITVDFCPRHCQHNGAINVVLEFEVEML